MKPYGRRLDGHAYHMNDEGRGPVAHESVLGRRRARRDAAGAIAEHLDDWSREEDDAMAALAAFEEAEASGRLPQCGLEGCRCCEFPESPPEWMLLSLTDGERAWVEAMRNLRESGEDPAVTTSQAALNLEAWRSK